MCASGSGQTAVGVLGEALESGGWLVRSRESGLVSVHPHSVWEPKGRVGFHPQSQAGWEGPGKLGAGGAGKASGFPVPGVHLPACFPQLLQLLRANACHAVPTQGTPCAWGPPQEGARAHEWDAVSWGLGRQQGLVLRTGGAHAPAVRQA